MADYVGRWNCEKCGAVVWGIMRHCPNCGANTTGRYYLPEGEPPITEEEVLSIVRAGPNWKCEHCDSDNYGDTAFCTECGAEKGTSPSRRVIEYDFGEVPTTAESADDTLGEGGAVGATDHYRHDSALETEALMKMADSPPWSSSSSASSSFHDRTFTSKQLGNVLQAVAIISVMAAAMIIGWLIFRPFEVNTTIDGFEWSRTIYIDHFATVREGAWSIPAGGRYVAQERRVHHYNRVLDHYEPRTREVPSGTERYVCGTTNNGNGTFSDRYCSRTTYRMETYQEPIYRQDPVYATWYHYDIDRWVHYRTVPTGGQNRSDPEPYWGEFTLECADISQLGCERENHREQHYVVVFEWFEGAEEERHEYRHAEDTQADWEMYEEQATYTLRLNGLGQLLNDPLRPETEE